MHLSCLVVNLNDKLSRNEFIFVTFMKLDKVVTSCMRGYPVCGQT